MELSRYEILEAIGLAGQNLQMSSSVIGLNDNRPLPSKSGGVATNQNMNTPSVSSSMPEVTVHGQSVVNPQLSKVPDNTIFSGDMGTGGMSADIWEDSGGRLRATLSTWQDDEEEERPQILFNFIAGRVSASGMMFIEDLKILPPSDTKDGNKALQSAPVTTMLDVLKKQDRNALSVIEEFGNIRRELQKTHIPIRDVQKRLHDIATQSDFARSSGRGGSRKNSGRAYKMSTGMPMPKGPGSGAF